jgi:hypothetical protein
MNPRPDPAFEPRAFDKRRNANVNRAVQMSVSLVAPRAVARSAPNGPAACGERWVSLQARRLDS